MKNTEWSTEWAAYREAAGKRNGRTEGTVAQRAVAKRTTHGRQADFNIGSLHDTVWEG